MLVRYSIVELLMIFEVSAQREHTIVCVCVCACARIYAHNTMDDTTYTHVRILSMSLYIIHNICVSSTSECSLPRHRVVHGPEDASTITTAGQSVTDRAI